MAAWADASAVSALPCSARSDDARPDVEEISPQALNVAASSHAQQDVPVTESHRLARSAGEIVNCSEERSTDGFMRSGSM
jgi:hypothetical protein